MDNGSSAAGATGAGMGGLLMGLLIGAVVGGVVALLFAPQSGSETRQMIKTRAGDIGNAFRGAARDMKATAERAGEQMKQGAEEIR